MSQTLLTPGSRSPDIPPTPGCPSPDVLSTPGCRSLCVLSASGGCNENILPNPGRRSPDELREDYIEEETTIDSYNNSNSSPSGFNHPGDCSPESTPNTAVPLTCLSDPGSCQMTVTEVPTQQLLPAPTSSVVFPMKPRQLLYIPSSMEWSPKAHSVPVRSTSGSLSCIDNRALLASLAVSAADSGQCLLLSSSGSDSCPSVPLQSSTLLTVPEHQAVSSNQPVSELQYKVTDSDRTCSSSSLPSHMMVFAPRSSSSQHMAVQRQLRCSPQSNDYQTDSDTDLALDMRQIRPQIATSVSIFGQETLSTTATTTVTESTSKSEPPLVYVCTRSLSSTTPVIPPSDPGLGRTDGNIYDDPSSTTPQSISVMASCDGDVEWQDRVLSHYIDGGATNRQIIITIDQSQRADLDLALRCRKNDPVQRKLKPNKGRAESTYDCVSVLAEQTPTVDITTSSAQFESAGERAGREVPLPPDFTPQFSTEFGQALQSSAVDDRSGALNIVLHADAFTSRQPQQHQERQDEDLQVDFTAPNTVCRSVSFTPAVVQSSDHQPAVSLSSHGRRSGRLECPICGQTQERLFWLRQHVKTHLVNGVYSCPFCEDKTFTAYSKIRKHIRSTHGDLCYVCQVCRKAFAAADKLRLHMLKHSDHREFLCSECGKQFKRKDKLKEHMHRKHVSADQNSPSENSISEVCVPQGSQSLTIGDTARRPSSGRAADFQKFLYKCRWCRVGFKRRGMLVNHLASRHAGYDPQEVPELQLPLTTTSRYYYCHHCDKVYRSSNKRKRHILKCHPGVPVPSRSDQTDPTCGDASYSCVAGCITSEPHCCTWCHRQYASRAKLLQHQRKLHADKLGTDAHVTCPAAVVPSVIPEETGYVACDDDQISESVASSLL